MSAFLNPSAAPSQAPERIAPQPVPAGPPPHSRRGWLYLAGLAAIAAMLAYWLRPQPQQKSNTVVIGVRTAKAAMGTLENRIRLAGQTSARNFANIAPPLMRGREGGRSLVLIHLATPGSMVKKGEVVAQMDPQALRDEIGDIDALVHQADADVKKRKAEQAIEMENLRQSLRQAKADLDKAKLDNSAAEIRTDIDREQLKLSVEEAEAQYKQLQQDLVTTQTLHRAEIRILELTRDRHMRHRDRHKVDLTKFTMHASMDGLVVMLSVWRGGQMGQVQEGDEVYPGQPFMKIVDPSSMQMEASINQAESEWIRLGQPAWVEFDAFPGLHLQGKVASIGALAVGGWRQNYYIRNIPVRISLDGQDSRVIPDLSASADVLLEKKAGMLLIPIEAVSSEGGKSVVFVKGSEGFERREVQLGPRNNTQVTVQAGLSAGDEVALEHPPAIS